MQKSRGDTLLIMSFSEDFTANSYKCASFFDGYRVVVGHAHGDFLEIGALLEVLSLEGVEEAGECLEFIADLGFVVGIVAAFVLRPVLAAGMETRAA